MAIFRIKPADSVFANAAGDHAFAAGTSDADTLIVDPGAFLVATGTLAAGATLFPTGASSAASALTRSQTQRPHSRRQLLANAAIAASRVRRVLGLALWVAGFAAAAVG